MLVTVATPRAVSSGFLNRFAAVLQLVFDLGETFAEVFARFALSVQERFAVFFQLGADFFALLFIGAAEFFDGLLLFSQELNAGLLGFIEEVPDLFGDHANRAFGTFRPLQTVWPLGSFGDGGRLVGRGASQPIFRADVG